MRRGVVAARERLSSGIGALRFVLPAVVANVAAGIDEPRLQDGRASRQRRALVGFDRRIGVDAAELVRRDQRAPLPENASMAPMLSAMALASCPFCRPSTIAASTMSRVELVIARWRRSPTGPPCSCRRPTSSWARAVAVFVAEACICSATAGGISRPRTRQRLADDVRGEFTRRRVAGQAMQAGQVEPAGDARGDRQR